MPLNRLRDYLHGEDNPERELRVHVRRTEEDEIEGVYLLFSPSELQHVISANRGLGALGGAFFLIQAGGQALLDEGLNINLN